MKTTTTTKSGGWSAIRKALTTWEKATLIALIKALYDGSELNRTMLQTRVLACANDGELLEKYRRKVKEPFFPTRGFDKLNLGDARKAIRDYRRATGSIAGTAELLLAYVENGTRFTREYGDIDERFYNSIESALTELATLLRGNGRTLYSQFAHRLAALETMSDGIGWGFHDFICDVVGSLEEELSGA
jgi:hypothetical protein